MELSTSGTVAGHKFTTSMSRQWLHAREGRAGETDKEIPDPLLDRTRDAILRVRQSHRRLSYRRQHGSPAFGALSADGGRRCCECGGESGHGPPLNGIVEVGGPEQFPFDEMIRLGLRACNDPREVIADPRARYFGTELTEYSLVPGNDALPGKIRFKEWLSQSADQTASTSPPSKLSARQ